MITRTTSQRRGPGNPQPGPPRRRGGFIHDTLKAVAVAPRTGPDAADLFNGTLRPVVVRSDKEHDAIDEAKGMLQHEALDFGVIPTAPV